MELKKEKCIASQLQNACKKINGTEPKFKDELELKRKMNCSFPRENGIYWTALRYEKVYYKRKTMANMSLMINCPFIITSETDGHNYDSRVFKC